MNANNSNLKREKQKREYKEGQVEGSYILYREDKLKKIAVFIIVMSLILIIFPLVNYIGPWLQNPGLKGPYLSWTEDPTTTMTISWQTPEECDSIVEYRREGESSYTSIKDSDKSLYHSITLDGLSPNKEYEYRIKSDTRDDLWGLDEQVYKFRTAPSTFKSFKFVIYGDNRIGNFKETAHKSIIRAILKEEDAAFTLNVGDLVHRPEKLVEWDRFFWEIKELAAIKPYFSALGNHEYDEGNNPDYGKNYFKFFHFPKPEWYYSFNYSNVHIIALNMSTSHLKISDEEIDWLENDLKKVDGKGFWKIIFFHVPPYSSGGHGENEEIIDKMVPIFEKYNAIVFCGHDHHYEHMKVDDIHYIITGGGGAPLNIEIEQKSYSIYMELTFCYTLVEIDGDEMEIITKRPDGSIVDQFTIKQD